MATILSINKIKYLLWSVPKRPKAYMAKSHSLIKCEKVRSITVGLKWLQIQLVFFNSLVLNSCNMSRIRSSHETREAYLKTQLQIDSIYYMSLAAKLQDKVPIYIKLIHRSQQCAFTLILNRIIWIFNRIIILL